MSAQPGYDELASAYDEAFPVAYTSAVERHAVAIFADAVLASGLTGTVLDIGCGTGHVAHDLSKRGIDVVGVDPSEAMLALAAKRYPDIRWSQGDARISHLAADDRLAGIIARFSLIHLDPQVVPEILTAWVERLQPGAHVLVAFQCSDDAAEPVVEFPHRVARAWRWRPDALSTALTAAGLSEKWRSIASPDDLHRYPECHLLHQIPV
ncbi:class I SAM-dependent methyltransferase [Nocardioides limicola]|uniref:class I SAM-dependent methyltransferase n=1 Tax=Nocardioides limicola TaxID=2803368 RepID=UPI00193B95F6|nr:class I SAM-dependent methyltransferase [Nocardioides sp. DJM-14]